MAAGRPGKKIRKKVRYKEISLKLSRNQQRSLVNYCIARQTTPTKLIKKMIRPFLSNYAREVPEDLYVTANQLDLFGQENNN